MRAESGIDSTAVNKDGGATGLIQFMPNSGSNYKIGGKIYTQSQLLSMGRVKQMDLVKDYFQQWGFKGQKQIGFFELYGVTFYPLMITENKSDDWILGSQTSTKSALQVAKQNSGIAEFSNRIVNGQKVIDVAAFKRYSNNRLSSTFL